MSVINKMLRDLDARRASAPGVSQEAGARALQGTAGMPQVASSPVRALRWLVGLLVLVAASATAWYLYEAGNLLADRPQPVVGVVLPPAPAPQPELSQPIVTATTTVQTDGALSALPVPAPTLTASAPTVTVPAPSLAASAPTLAAPPVALPMAQPQATPAAPRQPPNPAPRVEPEKVAAPQKPVRVASSPPVSRPTQAAVPVTAASPRRLPTERLAASPKSAAGSASGPSISPTLQTQRQTSAQETLAHAQGLWAAGSRDAALDMMREAVAVAERSYQNGTLAAGSPVLASLVRELARMELAEGRVSRVLELLTRLEPALAGQADLWAVRGNAAQRLARHQESVHAYLQALALRPDEPRWMLGAAVSLAALGRLDEAAVQAEKASAFATVSPESLTYLRQAGVPLK